MNNFNSITSLEEFESVISDDIQATMGNERYDIRNLTSIPVKGIGLESIYKDRETNGDYLMGKAEALMVESVAYESLANRMIQSREIQISTIAKINAVYGKESVDPFSFGMEGKIGDFIKKVWNAIIGGIRKFMNAIATWIRGVMNKIKSGYLAKQFAGLGDAKFQQKYKDNSPKFFISKETVKMKKFRKDSDKQLIAGDPTALVKTADLGQLKTDFNDQYRMWTKYIQDNSGTSKDSGKDRKPGKEMDNRFGKFKDNFVKNSGVFSYWGKVDSKIMKTYVKKFEDSGTLPGAGSILNFIFFDVKEFGKSPESKEYKISDLGMRGACDALVQSSKSDRMIKTTEVEYSKAVNQAKINEADGKVMIAGAEMAMKALSKMGNDAEAGSIKAKAVSEASSRLSRHLNLMRTCSSFSMGLVMAYISIGNYFDSTLISIVKRAANYKG